ncbi:MAG: hypothetical protein ACKO9H_13205, partial [Planctomycetota bacterium]
ALAVGMFAFVGGADDPVKLDGVKCIMMPKKDAKADKSVDYRGAKVYMCCDSLPICRPWHPFSAS